MAYLYTVTRDGRISNIPITKQKTTIGRSKNSDISLSDNTVSRHHAEITKTPEGYLLTDQGSYNGTRANGVPIETAYLKHGDRIQLGLAKLTFKEEGSTAHEAANSLVLTTDEDYESGVQQILKSSPLESHGGSEELLLQIRDSKEIRTRENNLVQAGADKDSQEYLARLARTNRVLFVLYELSQQLNQLYDLQELLRKILDLIFMVIDADYGFLILTSGHKGDELIPVVVKHKGDRMTGQREIRASRTLIDKVIHDKVALLTSNAMADSRLDGAQSVMLRQIRSAICVPLWQKGQIIGVIQLESVRLDNQFTQDDLELLKAIGSQTAMVIEQAALNEQIREEERMRSRLERFHSPQIIEMILKGGQETKEDIMEPKELTATILFTDIIGFTHLAETMPAREVNILLNRYFSRMTDAIFSHDGTLDKYIGDGMMAVFGPPVEKRDDAERCIQAALEIRRQLSNMMQEISEERRFDIRIGINTGRVVAGNIGSPKRMDYTVIGDPVNMASRLESIAGPNQILIGEETFRRVKGKFKIQRVGAKKVRGKSSEIMVYEVLG